MTSTKASVFSTIVNELTQSGDLRTWSVIVTIFGDLAQNSTDSISGPLLSVLTQPIGIKPQAMRVALHRLRRDGWIVTVKNGRTSRHLLSDYGLEQSLIASPRIYEQVPEMPENWHILAANRKLTNTHKTLIENGYLCAFPGIYIGIGEAPADTSNYLVLEGRLTSIPPWLQKRVVEQANVNDYVALGQHLTSIRRMLDGGFTSDPIETAVIRSLIVHNWRRIVLRQPDLSAELLGNSVTTTCRALVRDLLESLGRPSLAELEMAIGKP
ncbi:MAG: PaaX family transcriptional regulator C-terminal domain-containing protein [Paracoccaceae bacterium]